MACRAFLIAVACLWIGSSPAPAAPDARGEDTVNQPAYHGRTANAPIPPEMHIRNEGGSDGAGLCVICSIIIGGQYQGVPGLDKQKASALWKAAKSRPGGYYPEKLKKLVEEVMPGEKYASYLGKDPSILSRLSAAGYPVGVTMNTGALYSYQPIHHMVTLIHYDSTWVCVVDNNDPGHYHVMPTAEFNRRWIDGDAGWAWVWTRLPRRKAAAGGAAVVVFLAAAIGNLCAGGGDDESSGDGDVVA